MDYGSIIKRSWELTKKYKWLWVPGLVLVSFGGGGSNFPSGGGGSGLPSDGIRQKLPEDLPQKTSQVLGQATDAISQWFRAVPLSTWIVLGLVIFLLILLFIILAWIIRSWAKGALIAGLADADQNKAVTLLSTSPKGLSFIQPLMIYSLIAIGITLGVIFALLIIGGLGYLVFSFSNLTRILWLVLAAIFGGLALLIAFILFAMTSLYADRLIVLRGTPPWPAWKTGFSLARQHFLPTLVMGIINHTIGCVAGCFSLVALLIVLGIPAVILVIPIFRDGFHLPSPPVITVLILLFLIFICLNLLIRAVLTVFSYGVWNLFFNQILKEEQQHE